MKTWTMPRVMIEAFTANEYVAGSCVNKFATNETQIKAILDTASGFQNDWNGSTDGWGYAFNAEHHGHISSSTMTESMWNLGLTGPYDTWALLRAGQEQAAKNMGFEIYFQPFA